MKRLSFLRTLVNIFFVLCMIAVILVPPTLIMISIFPEMVPFSINGTHPGDIDAEQMTVLICAYAGYAFFVYATYLFKNTLALFAKKVIFDDRIIKNFDQMGKAIVIGYFVIAVPGFLYYVTTVNHIEVSPTLGFNETLLTLGLGLFFIVLSDVFRIAKEMKEENDLTV